jgi:hypothetical protein
MLVLFGIGAVASAWLMIQSRRTGVPRSENDWHWTVVAFAVFVSLIVGGLHTVKHHGAHVQSERNRRPATVARGHVGQTSPPKNEPADGTVGHVNELHLRWPLALMVGALLCGIALSLEAVARHRRRKTPTAGDQAQLAETLEEVLGDGLNELRLERDPRRAVIRAYVRMEHTFAEYGVPP